MGRIVLVTSILAPLNRCFDVARSIDLHKRSTAHTHEQAIAGTTTGLISLGEQVTWRAWHLGFPWTLTSRITAMDAPTYFQDTMLQGPFRSLVHDHFFTQTGVHTTMTDVFVFESPFGFLGRWVNRLFLDEYLERFLQRRNNFLKQFAESNQPL